MRGSGGTSNGVHSPSGSSPWGLPWALFPPWTSLSQLSSSLHSSYPPAQPQARSAPYPSSYPPSHAPAPREGSQTQGHPRLRSFPPVTLTLGGAPGLSLPHASRSPGLGSRGAGGLGGFCLLLPQLLSLQSGGQEEGGEGKRALRAAYHSLIP